MDIQRNNGMTSDNFVIVKEHEEALQASAAKILKLDEPGEQVKDIFLNSSLNENVEDVSSETLIGAEASSNAVCGQVESSTLMNLSICL